MKKIKVNLNNKIVNLFSRLIKIFALFYVYIPRIFQVLNFDKKNKFYRSILIRQTLNILRDILISLDYNLPIIIKNNRVIIDVDGVLLIPDKINRYYKITNHCKYFNEAKYLEDLFDFSSAKIFIDIGACIGEYSIYFAKKYSQIQIYSIESNKEFIKLLNDNIKINKVNKSIQIIENAISDINNQNYYILAKSQQSEVVISKQNSKDKTITLSSLISEKKFDKIDFIKIDIEGSNYKVAQCIIDNAPIIEGIQYEFAKGPTNTFLNLIDQVNIFYSFYLLENNEFKSINVVDLKNKIKLQGSHITNGFDVFFKKKIIQ
jgi:FkbM family methyltransferase